MLKAAPSTPLWLEGSGPRVSGVELGASPLHELQLRAPSPGPSSGPVPPAGTKPTKSCAGEPDFIPRACQGRGWPGVSALGDIRSLAPFVLSHQPAAPPGSKVTPPLPRGSPAALHWTPSQALGHRKGLDGSLPRIGVLECVHGVRLSGCTSAVPVLDVDF